jgi:hypothetical protein
VLLLKQLEGWCFPCVPPQYVLAVFPDLEAIFAGKPHVDMQKLEFLVLQAVLALVLRRIDECGTDGACNDMSNGDFWLQFSLVDSVTLETEAGYSVCLKGLPTTARRLSILEKACPAPHADDFNVRTCALLGGTCALIHCRMHLP